MKHHLLVAGVAALAISAPSAAQELPRELAEAREGNEANSLLTPEQRADLARQADLIAGNYNSSVDSGNANRARRSAAENRRMEGIDAQIRGSDAHNIDSATEIVDGAIEITLNGSENIRESQRRIEDLGRQMEALAQQRADMIAANPNATPAQIREAREQITRMRDVREQVSAEVSNSLRQLDAISAQQIAERGDIIRDIESGSLQSTRRAAQRLSWQLSQVTLRDPQAMRDALRRAERAAQQQGQQQPRPLPNFDPPAAPAPSASPPPAPPSPAANPRPSRRGEIPPADPYADFRAQRGQSGANTTSQTPSEAAAQAAANAARQRAAQAQAEANAARTEALRQAAQNRANAENAEADRIFGAAQREREARLRREYNEMLEYLRRQSRYGNAGGGGNSGGAATGASSSYEVQMAYGNGLPDGSPSSVEQLGYGELEQGYAGQFSPTEAFVFDDGGSFTYQRDAWQSFEMGGTVILAELLAIYDGYDWWNAPVGSSGRSLSSAGNSPSSAGNSPSSAGMSLSAAGSITPSSAPSGMRVDWGGYNLAADPLRVSNGGRPQPGSYAEMLRQLYGPGPSIVPSNPWTDAPWATSNRDLAAALFGPLWSDRPYQLQADPNGSRGQSMGGPELANLHDTDFDRLLRLLGSDFAWVRNLLANDRGGLDRLLAQPFNVLLTWGPDAYDLDLHMTGPLETADQRFHIYYAARGQLTAQPFAELIRDCICASGSEVILTSALNQGSGVYRVSVFNFGDQSATSTNLSGQSDAVLQIVRGGVAVPVGNGTTIEGGVTLLTTSVPAAGAGNTWVAAEINPNNGTITAPGVIVQSQGSAGVN